MQNWKIWLGRAMTIALAVSLLGVGFLSHIGYEKVQGLLDDTPKLEVILTEVPDIAIKLATIKCHLNEGIRSVARTGKRTYKVVCNNDATFLKLAIYPVKEKDDGVGNPARLSSSLVLKHDKYVED